MALQLRPSCEYCDKDLPPNSTQARICSYECTFCADCVESKLATSAQTAAADLSRGRSGRRGNGGRECRLQNTHHRASGCICRLASRISRRIRRGFVIFRRRSVEPVVVIPGWSEGP